MSPRLLKNHPILLAEATLDMSTALLKKNSWYWRQQNGWKSLQVSLCDAPRLVLVSTLDVIVVCRDAHCSHFIPVTELTQQSHQQKERNMMNIVGVWLQSIIYHPTLRHLPRNYQNIRCDRFLRRVSHQNKLWWSWKWTEQITSICFHYLATQHEKECGELNYQHDKNCSQGV